MRVRFRAAIVLGALALAACAALVAQARPTATSSWARVSGPTQPGAQLGLARTKDGVLHVIWNRGNSNYVDLRDSLLFRLVRRPEPRRSRRAGRATAASRSSSCRTGTLRLFTPGVGGINTFTAAAGGGSWSHQSGAAWGGAIAESAYVIGATLTKDGQPVTAWRGNAAEGVPPGSIPADGYQGGDGRSRTSRPTRPAAPSCSPGRRMPGRAAPTSSRSCRALGPKVVLGATREGVERRSECQNRSARRLRCERGRQGRQSSTATVAARRRSRGGPFTSAGVCAGPTEALGRLGRSERRGLRHTLRTAPRARSNRCRS